MTTTAEHPLDLERDIARIDYSQWPAGTFPQARGQRRPGYQVVIAQSVLNAMYKHGHSMPQTEICGVLVGRGMQDELGPFLLVDASIEGDHAEGHAAQVTFTADTWLHIQEVMDREHADRRIVGWYHTHPGFGIFLSGMDLFIQDNFFNLPWQFAFVYDPVNDEQGLFAWKEGRAARSDFLVMEDEPPTHSPNSPSELEKKPPEESPAMRFAAGALDAPPASDPPKTLEEAIERIGLLERRQKWLQSELEDRIAASERRLKLIVILVGFLASFTVAWALVFYSSVSDKPGAATRPTTSAADVQAVDQPLPPAHSAGAADESIKQ
ncbi:MAG TPA: Mov34/MPN/PAD-1 family protein [Tepidisphaeraceae bacterium]|jgi:proteasome lid subunit RPN8/RPN11